MKKFEEMGKAFESSFNFENFEFSIRIKKDLRPILRENLKFKFGNVKCNIDKVPIEEEDTTEGIKFKCYYNL